MLHTREYSSIKSPLETNDIGNILGKKGLPFAVGGGHQVQSKLLLPAFTHAHIPGLSPGFWSKGGNDQEGDGGGAGFSEGR